MNGFFRLRALWAILVFAVADVLCFAMGMGVPVFCILLGFLVGWYLVRRVTSTTRDLSQVLRKVLRYSFATASFTFLLALLTWGRCASWLFRPDDDLAQFGIPLILFEPRPSFIAWLGLMIFVSPFLQLLTTLFSSYLTAVRWSGKNAVRQ